MAGPRFYFFTTQAVAVAGLDADTLTCEQNANSISDCLSCSVVFWKKAIDNKFMSEVCCNLK